jgi:transposase-like protein
MATTCAYTKPSGGRSWNYQLLKMAALLQSCTKQEMRSVIRFLNAEGAKPVEMYRRMLAKYISRMNETQVYEWVQKFKNGAQSAEESPRPGQAHRVVTPEMIAAVDDLIRENRRITINEIAMEMKIRRCTWTSLQIGWGGKGGGTWLAGTATKIIFLRRNLCLSGTLEEMCRTWQGLHWNWCHCTLSVFPINHFI